MKTRSEKLTSAVAGSIDVRVYVILAVQLIQTIISKLAQSKTANFLNGCHASPRVEC